MSKNKDLDNVFEQVITKGRIEEEKEVFEGFKVKMHPLNQRDLISAETVFLSSLDRIPRDVIQKTRMVSIATKATISVNGVEIEQEDMTREEKQERRESLYKKYMELSPDAIRKVFDFYLELVRKQEDIFNSSEEVKDGIENF